MTTETGDRSNVIDFYFDFLSPYGYFGSIKIDEIAARHGFQVNWKVFLVGAAFKLTGQKPAGERAPMAQQFGFRDIMRSAAFHGAPFRFPKVFGTSCMLPSRAYYWLYDRDRAMAHVFAKQVYHKVFAEEVDMRQRENLAPVLDGIGLHADTVMDWAESDEGKTRFRQETDDAIARGVFGSPFFFVDGEGFWGSDRLEQLEWWLISRGERAAKVEVS